MKKPKYAYKEARQLRSMVQNFEDIVDVQMLFGDLSYFLQEKADRLKKGKKTKDNSEDLAAILESLSKQIGVQHSFLILLEKLPSQMRE